MNKREFFVVFLILFFVTAIFFYKTFLHGLVSFPGDLLIAEYNPWKTYSYLGYNPGSYPNKAQYFDVLRQLYPWKTFAVDLIKQGILCKICEFFDNLYKYLTISRLKKRKMFQKTLFCDANKAKGLFRPISDLHLI